MGAPTSKVFLSLRGVPVLAYSLQTISRLDDLKQLVVVVAEQDLATAADIVGKTNGVSKTIQLVSGGEERQDSVANGLASIGNADGLIMVHDAARPFVSLACMQRCIGRAATTGAAIVAVPAHDTVKLCDDGLIKETIDRRRVWLAQTPQVFRADWLRQAYHTAKQERLRATDDSALLERCGYTVSVVEGEPANRKLTAPEDLRWAEWHLDQQR